ncbi:MAG TPA: methyltransferase domain-containing protein [Anaerolineaceae bacterium]|nr:methyltransferase domain-containing protein [Anaerolineaceae bacterium]
MYDLLSRDYDRFVNWPNRLAFEMPFLLKQLGSIKKPEGTPLRVLDAACGTGQHVLALAKEGMQAAGADLSLEMIRVARENASAAGADLCFEAVGFGSLAQMFGEGNFDALLCLGNSLPHLLTQTELASALNDFHACLAPGGLLLIQNRNFDSVLAKHERWMDPQAHNEGEHQWVFQRFYDFEPDGLIRFNIVTLYREGSEEWRARLTSTHLFPQTHADLAAALTHAGFTNPRFFGSLGGGDFDTEKSGNLVITAIKD